MLSRPLKIKYATIILFVLISSTFCTAQLVETKDYRLSWKTSSDNIKNTSFSFDNSITNDKDDVLPLFYSSVACTNKTLLSAIIIPIKSNIVSLSDSLMAFIKNDQFDMTSDITEIRGQYYLNTVVTPFKKNSDGKVEVLQDFQIQYVYAESNNIVRRSPPATFTSALSDGSIFKVSVDKSGIHKIDKTFLEAKLGITIANINPKNIKIYGNRGGIVPEANNTKRTDDLVELPIFVSGESDGKFDNGDYILFYAEGPDKWSYNSTDNSFAFEKNIYDNKNYYYLKMDGAAGNRVTIKTFSTNNPEYTTTEYDKIQRLEEDKVNLLGSYTGTEGTGKSWYGDIFKFNSEKDYSSSFNFENIIPSSSVEVDFIFSGRSPSTSSVTLNIGGKNISKNISNVNVLNAESLYARRTLVKDNATATTSSMSIKLSYTSSSSDAEGWIDYIQLVSRHKLLLGSSQLAFRDRQTKSYNTAAIELSGFTDQVIWDITDPLSPSEMQVLDKKLNFQTNGEVREFISFNKSNGIFEPGALGKIENQNLHGITDADLLIVYHPMFKSEALRLANHRQNQSNIKVAAVQTDQVYNEFSSGRVDPGAIRDMAKMLLSRNPNFRYLLLFGDGSYDYKGLVNGLSPENFVPVYETDESLDPIEGFPSDDFYGLLGDNEGLGLRGSIDVYVGRLPAKTQDEAKVLVDKIIHYETSAACLGDWRMKIGYTADDEDSNTHLRDMDDVAKSDEVRSPVYNQQKVYLDAYTQVSTPGESRYPEANRALNDNVFKGQLTLTYLGHGGPLGWAQERVLTVSDILSWNNYNALTTMITATCSFAAYDDPAVVTPAEYAILNPKGGAIALLSTTRAVYTSSNKLLTDASHQLMFKKLNGTAPTLGYILGEGKNKYQGPSFQTNSRKFTLLGDPSMQIAMPKYDIITTSINGKDPAVTRDTLNALEKVTIKGQIMDEKGQVVTSFNGSIFPTVYDKKSTLQTLGNDARSPIYGYTAYKNILFKGSASVANGQWSFSFWVPKNINYSFGNGRISYYATDGDNIDAGGVFNDFVVGGTNAVIVNDDQGPQVDIYLNDESFVYGGLTNANPVLLLKLEDDFGINVTGNAIGQDITAILDGNDQNVYILNDFYESEKDDFTSGLVRFPLTKLEKGSHTIVAKAWDISGNSSERRSEFVVADSGDNILKHVLNYPNPFSTHTLFQFEHDIANTELDIFVDIYTISGKLVKTIHETKYSSGFRVNDVGWTGKDDFDSKLAKGVYLYKISVRSKESNITRESKFEKLVIL